MSQKVNALPDLSKYYFNNIFIMVYEPMSLTSPVKYLGSSTDSPPLLELGTALRIDTKNQSVRVAFAQHEKRLKSYKFWHVVYSWLVYLVIAVLAALIMGLAVSLLPPFKSRDFSYLILAVMLIAAYITFRSANRVSSLLFDSNYADTLSFVAGLYLLANVARENALVRAEDRKRILQRIRALRRYVSLLPHQFAVTDSPCTSRARGQFACMEQFLEEKENQVIAPLANSQTDLFVALRAFVEVLLTANYGEFKAQRVVSAKPAPEPGRAARILTGTLKFLGTVTPAFLLLSLIFFPQQLTFLGLQSQMISYISLAWLLLAIDANLKLGIVEGVVNLARTFKDLS